MRVSESRVLRKIYGSKKDEATGEWRIVYNEKLYALYSSPNISPVIKSSIFRWSGHVERMGTGKVHSKGFGGEPEGTSPPGRSRLTREDNIKIDFQEFGWGMDW
jgi:hypothetical protein